MISRLVVATLPVEEARPLAESLLASGEPRASAAPPTAEAIPFVQAALIGSLAAAVLAAVAVLISHS
jgi:hypothetical protein